MDYFLQGDGFARVTNAVPCPVWLFKTGFTEEKALFKGYAEDVQLDISDALGFPEHRTQDTTLSMIIYSNRINTDLTVGPFLAFHHQPVSLADYGDASCTQCILLNSPIFSSFEVWRETISACPLFGCAIAARGWVLGGTTHWPNLEVMWKRMSWMIGGDDDDDDGDDDDHHDDGDVVML